MIVYHVYHGEGEAQEGLGSLHKYLKGECKKDGARHFSVVPSDRTRGSGHELKHRWFLLNITSHFLITVRETEHWQRVPTEVLDSPSIPGDIQKPPECSAGHLAIDSPVCVRWLDQTTSRSHFQPQ